MELHSLHGATQKELRTCRMTAILTALGLETRSTVNLRISARTLFWTVVLRVFDCRSPYLPPARYGLKAKLSAPAQHRSPLTTCQGHA